MRTTMTPEMMFVRELGTDLEKSKLAHQMSQMSTEDLESLFFEKEAAPSTKALMDLAKTVGGTASKGLRAAGSHLEGIKNPLLRNAAIGGAIGGVGGVATGAAVPDKDPKTGKSQRLKSMATRGAKGAVSGLVGGALAHTMFPKAASVQRLEAALEKQALGVGTMLAAGGKRMLQAATPVAKGLMRSGTNAASGVMGAAQKAFAGGGARGVLNAGASALNAAPMAKAVGVGAGLGAGAGALKGLAAPGADQYGQPRSRLGAMAGGAIKGGIGGGLLGAGGKALATPKATV